MSDANAAENLKLVLATSRRARLGEDEIADTLQVLSRAKIADRPVQWYELRDRIKVGKSAARRHDRARFIIMELRARGVPVCNDKVGYFIGTAEQALRHVDRSRGMYRKAFETFDVMSSAIRKAAGMDPAA